MLKWASCAHSARHQFASSRCTPHNSFLWFRRGLTQCSTQEMFSSCRDIQFPVHSVTHKYPGTKFFPTASLHNQCMPRIPLWDENYLRRREMNSFWQYPHSVQVKGSCTSLGAFGKDLRPSGMVWKKWCLPYFLILVSKHRKLKVNSFGLTLQEFTLLKKWGDSMFCRSFYEEVIFASHSIDIACTTTTSDYLPNT